MTVDEKFKAIIKTVDELFKSISGTTDISLRLSGNHQVFYGTVTKGQHQIITGGAIFGSTIDEVIDIIYLRLKDEVKSADKNLGKLK